MPTLSRNFRRSESKHNNGEYEKGDEDMYVTKNVLDKYVGVVHFNRSQLEQKVIDTFYEVLCKLEDAISRSLNDSIPWTEYVVELHYLFTVGTLEHDDLERVDNILKSLRFN